MTAESRLGHTEPVQSGDERAGFEVVPPPVPAHLRSVVASWTGYREWSLSPVRRVEYPTGRAVLIFEFDSPLGVGRLGGALTRHGGFFAGIDDLPSLTQFERAQAGIQVNLSVEGALSVAGTPLARQVVSLSALGFRRSLGDELASATWPRRFETVTRVLEALLERGRRPSQLLLWAVERIDTAHGSVRIEALSEALRVSRSFLHARFVDELGLSPKRYADLRRFARGLERLRRGDFVDLATLALDLGYADQAHLAREVKRFAGGTSRAVAEALREPLSLAVRENASDAD